ncbi:MAG: hypothetical protein ABW136_10785 [Steroidobacteraceae bacterium]
MNLPFEIGLPLGALAFYVYDSALLLHDDELIFVRQGRRWHATTGSEFVLFGKRVCLPAPLMPWCALVRSTWRMTDESQAIATMPAIATSRALLPLKMIGTTLLALLIFALPYASLVLKSGLLMLAVFAVYYALLFVALAYAFVRRVALGLTGRAYWTTALDVLACPPFAVNFVRRITLRQELEGDALAYIRGAFEAEPRARAFEQLRRRIDERLGAAAADPGRAARLEKFRESLRAEGD